jgi:hypothetical protein
MKLLLGLIAGVSLIQPNIADACIKSPKKLTLKVENNDPSFVENDLSVTTRHIEQEKANVAIFVVDDTALFYSEKKKTWCTLDDTVTCLKPDDEIKFMDKNMKRETALVETNGKNLLIWSIDKKGNKDTSKPYLSLEDVSSSELTGLEVNAMTTSKQLGRMTYVDIKQVTERSIDPDTAPSEGFSLNGNDIVASTSCGKRSDVLKFDASVKKGGSSGSK